MLIEDMRKIAAARTQGPWLERTEAHDYYPGHKYLGINPYRYIKGGKEYCKIEDKFDFFETHICRIESGKNDKEFIVLAEKTYDALLDIAEAAKIAYKWSFDCRARIEDELRLHAALKKLEDLK